MSGYPDHPAAQPFFLEAQPGKRFCIYYAPDAEVECQGVFIYVHPFGDEMNKARRMAALQARAFSAIGFGVLQMDLFGCGDSSGEFEDATWEIWRGDLAIAKKWLEDHVPAPLSLWGLRLGALLALDFARQSESAIDKIVLWQPVLNGEKFLTQFLRLRLANEMLAGGDGRNTGTRALRDALAAGKVLDIAGYGIAPALAAAIDSLDAAEWVIKESAMHWFDIVSEPERPMAPAGTLVASKWAQAGMDLHVHTVPCAPFWATQEVSECTELLSATARIFTTAHP